MRRAYVDPLSLPGRRILLFEPRSFSPGQLSCGTDRLVSHTVWLRLGLVTGLQLLIHLSHNLHNRVLNLARRRRNHNSDNYCHAPSAASERSRSVFKPIIDSSQSNIALTHHCQCDRTKPCSACCARGHPKECEFATTDGNDYAPISQSYEIRDLRRENQKLREQLRDARARYSAGDDDDVESPDQSESKATSRATAAKQRRFRMGERIDNLYFGTPGLANIVSDVSIGVVSLVNPHADETTQFANLQIGSHSLTHTIPLVPKGQDIYPAEDQDYPFQMIPIGDNTPAALLELLPSDEEIFQHFEHFKRRAQSCSFPHVPDEITKKEVERFLADRKSNANKAPDMLALIFAALAVGMQIGVYDRNGCQWLKASMAESHLAGKAWRKFPLFLMLSRHPLTRV